MAEFLNQIAQVGHSFFSTNGTNSSGQCVSTIDEYAFHLYTLIPAILISLSLAITRSRRSVLLSLFGGRPGLIVPMDSFTRHAKKTYACAFGATVDLVYKIVLEKKSAFPYSGPRAAESFVNIASTLIYGLVFFPVFASLAVGSVYGYGLGALYVWMLTGVEIYKLTECQANTEDRIVVVFRALPGVLCLLYLSVSVLIRVILEIRRRRFFVWDSDVENTESLEEIQNMYYGIHVKKLFRKRKIKERKKVEGRLKKVKAFITNFVQQKRYHRKKNFLYPSRLLSVMLVSLMVVYQCTVLSIAFARTFWEKGRPQLVDYLLREGKDETYIFLFDSLAVCFYIAVPLAFVITLINILHTLSTFRNHLLTLYKGDYSYIPPASSSKNAMYCVWYMQHAGFQVGYIVVAFVMQTFAIWMCIYTLSLVDHYAHAAALNFLETLWPWILTYAFLMGTQIVLAKFFFAPYRGRHLALDNRRCFFVFTYFMFFYNMFIGAASCILRILESVVVGLVFLGRLDLSILSRKAESLDLALKAYLGYIYMEYAHSNPVAIVFVRLMLLHTNKEARAVKSRQTNTFVNMEEIGMLARVIPTCYSAFQELINEVQFGYIQIIVSNDISGLTETTLLVKIPKDSKIDSMTNNLAISLQQDRIKTSAM